MTLNEIKAFLNRVVGAVPDLKSRFFMEQKVFESREDRVFPAINFDLDQIPISITQNLRAGTTGAVFLVTITSKKDVNADDGEDADAFRIISDCAEIAMDLLSQIANNDKITFGAGALQPYDDSSGDRCAGVVFVLTITTPINLGSC